MRIPVSAIIVALWLALVGSASAQETTGTLTGKLTDGQGLALPGVTVTVTGTQGARSFVTDGEGLFRAPFLVPGAYDVRAELQGFKAVEQKAVPVSLGQTTSITLKLEVGGITETVSVVGTSTIVNTSSTTTGAVLSSEMLATIPVGRRFTDTLYLAPGVSSGGSVGRANPSVSGGSGLDNLYVVDGVNVTNTGYGAVGSYSIIFGSLGTATPFDFIKEIQIKTGGYEAEYGQSMGGVVNVVTKSGTNQFRGSLFGYCADRRDGSGVEDLPVGQRHGEHRGHRTFRRRHGSRLPAAPQPPVLLRRRSTRPGRSAPSSPPTASRCRAWAKSIATGCRCPTPARPPGRRPRRIASTCRCSAIRPRATWGRSAPRRCWSPTGRRSASSSTAATTRRCATTACSSPNLLFEASASHAFNKIAETPSVDAWRVTDTTVVPNIITGGIGAYEKGNESKNYQYTAKATWVAGGHQVKIGGLFEDVEYAQVNQYTGPTFTAPTARRPRPARQSASSPTRPSAAFTG